MRDPCEPSFERMSSRDSAYFSSQRRSPSADELLKKRKDEPDVGNGDLLRNLLKEKEKSWSKRKGIDLA